MPKVPGKPVRVIKRSEQTPVAKNPPRPDKTRTPAQLQREMAQVVISWITERKSSNFPGQMLVLDSNSN